MPRRQIQVFAEGKKTEQSYLTYLARRNRDKVLVHIDKRPGPPMALVERAVAQKLAEERAAKKGEGDAHDEYWCVFDVDEHPTLDDAIRLASEHGIKVAVSNPCFELWLTLHYADQTADIDRKGAQRKASHLTRGKKALSDEVLESLDGQFDDARRRALALDAKHAADGTPARANPSSSVWRLVDRIRHADQPIEDL